MIFLSKLMGKSVKILSRLRLNSSVPFQIILVQLTHRIIRMFLSKDPIQNFSKSPISTLSFGPPYDTFSKPFPLPGPLREDRNVFIDKKFSAA